LRLKNVSKGFLIPELDMIFEILEFLLELIHFGTFRQMKSIPGIFDEIFQCGMSERERLKAKWSLIGIT